MSFGPVTRRQYSEILGVPGPQGPPGRDGSGDVFRVPFAYNTPSPLILQTIAPGKTNIRASILVKTAFNGDGSSISLGTTTTPTLIFTTPDIDLTSLGVGDTFDNFAIFDFASADYLILTIS